MWAPPQLTPSHVEIDGPCLYTAGRYIPTEQVGWVWWAARAVVSQQVWLDGMALGARRPVRRDVPVPLGAAPLIQRVGGFCSRPLSHPQLPSHPQPQSDFATGTSMSSFAMTISSRHWIAPTVAPHLGGKSSLASQCTGRGKVGGCGFPSWRDAAVCRSALSATTPTSA